MSAQQNLRLQVERLEDRVMLSGVPQEVVVMSENLYMGADPVPILAASVLGSKSLAGPALTKLAVTNFWNNVKATNYPKRADAIAQQIAANKPDLIGLQEVMTYYTGSADSLNGNATQASNVELDFLNILQSKLTAKGLKYKAYSQPLGGFEAPGYINGKLQDLRLVDSMVILARNDLPATQVSYAAPQGGKFNETVSFSQSLLGPIDIHRGWNSIDVSWGQSQFRFINMCLETPVFPLTQAIHGTEILLGPALTAKPVILVGDSNSNGANPGKPFSVLDNTFTYSMLTADYGSLVPGFTLHDAWTQTHTKGDPGYTWGNQPDLKNSQPMSYKMLGLGQYRMDLVLHRELFQATSMKRLGVDAQTRAVLGMWPSDHAGVVATLAIKQPANSATDYGVSQFVADSETTWSLLNDQIAEAFSSQLAIFEMSDLPELALKGGLASLIAIPTTTDLPVAQCVRVACELVPYNISSAMEQAACETANSFAVPLEECSEREVVSPADSDSLRARVWETLWDLDSELIDGAVHELLGELALDLLTADR